MQTTVVSLSVGDLDVGKLKGRVYACSYAFLANGTARDVRILLPDDLVSSEDSELLVGFEVNGEEVGRFPVSEGMNMLPVTAVPVADGDVVRLWFVSTEESKILRGVHAGFKYIHGG